MRLHKMGIQINCCLMRLALCEWLLGHCSAIVSRFYKVRSDISILSKYQIHIRLWFMMHVGYEITGHPTKLHLENTLKTIWFKSLNCSSKTLQSMFAFNNVTLFNIIGILETIFFNKIAFVCSHNSYRTLGGSNTRTKLATVNKGES